MPDATLADPVGTSAAGSRPVANGGARAALGSRWHLAVVAGPDPGWCHAVRRDAQHVGRHPGCDVSLADPEVSRRHLEVRERRGQVEARDLGSANGTRVRMPGRRLVRRRRRRLGARWRRLPEGTDLAVGRTVLRVRARPGLDVGGGVGQETAAPGGSADAGRSARPRPPWTTLLLSASSLPILLGSGATGLRLLAFLLVPLVLVVAVMASGAGRRNRLPPGSAQERRKAAHPPRRGQEHPSPDAAAVLLAACSAPAAVPAGDRSGAQRPDPSALPACTVLVPGGHQVDPFRGGPIALIGSPAATAAAARWLVCQLAVDLDSALGLRLAASPTTDLSSWRWLLEFPHVAAPGGEGDGGRQPERLLRIFVDAAAARLGAWTIRAGAAQTALVLVRALDDVPAWCRRVIEVSDDDGQLVGSAWAQCVGKALAVREAERPRLGRDVEIAPLLADPATTWPQHDTGLGAVFAVGAGGPVTIDLARDGPHALVAGTTGSGKSELLLCWVLALACRYPPSALTVVAIDYKGGATFGSLARLPHVADVLTDLDGAGTARALAGLRAELARRERLLAAAGARDLDDYRGIRGSVTGARPALGRLLVVVDEFRALADEHPDLLAGLARLAAQGRSLGIHLVLATQRPAGALSADLRANLRVAICLRVLSPADSLDVIGNVEAARLPAVPGRAIVHGLGADPAGDVVQAAWGGTAGVARALAQIESVARRHGQPPAAPLWAPPLPAQVRAETAPEPTGAGHAGGLALGLRDLPEERRLAPWAWPTRNPLLIAGGPGAGRTTALLALATAALNRGWTLHLVHGHGESLGTTPAPELSSHGGLGTAVGTDDPRRIVRLLELVQDVAGPALLCIDDVDAVLAACERVRGTSGTERIARILRDTTDSLAVAVAGPLDMLGARWAASARHRVVLGQLDGGQGAIAGVPRTMLTARCGPGRGVLLGDGPATALQTFLPEPLRSTPPPGTGLDGHPPRLLAGNKDGAGRWGPSGSPSPIRGPRLLPIPRAPGGAEVLAVAGCSTSGAPDGTAVPLGLGGDDAGVLWLDVRPGARIVIAGPTGSGRTNTLDWLAGRLGDLGHAVRRVAPGGEPPPRGELGLDDGGTVLVDDGDLLDRHAAEQVAEQWHSRRGVVVVAVRTETLAAGYAGVGAVARDARDVLLLAPLRGGTGHLAPGEVLPHADPADPRRPGRGVLVGPRGAVPIQLPLAEAGP